MSILFMYGFRPVLERRVYELNTAARKIRLQSAMSLVEQTVVPVVKSKCTEVRVIFLTLCILMDSSFWYDTINLG